MEIDRTKGRDAYVCAPVHGKLRLFAKKESAVCSSFEDGPVQAANHYPNVMEKEFATMRSSKNRSFSLPNVLLEHLVGS